jgi:DNA-binding MarR family transcriptional regulator
MENPATLKLDRLVHNEPRRQILQYLAEHGGEGWMADIREALGINSGVLANRYRPLEEAGYVYVRREVRNGSMWGVIVLTPRGNAALSTFKADMAILLSPVETSSSKEHAA